MNKSERMDQLKNEAAKIDGSGTNLVWGEGNLDSTFVIVGEAPAAEEDRQGRPFVGRAGRFLSGELELAGISRERIYITNVIKRRLTRIKGNMRTNCPPNKKDIGDWSGILLCELEIVHPSTILCFGNTAASVLIHEPFAMTRDRGKWFDGPLGARVIATFHPAYVTRFGSMQDGSIQKIFRRDLRKAAAELVGF